MKFVKLWCCDCQKRTDHVKIKEEGHHGSLEKYLNVKTVVMRNQSGQTLKTESLKLPITT